MRRPTRGGSGACDPHLRALGPAVVAATRQTPRTRQRGTRGATAGSDPPLNGSGRSTGPPSCGSDVRDRISRPGWGPGNVVRPH